MFLRGQAPFYCTQLHMWLTDQDKRDILYQINDWRESNGHAPVEQVEMGIEGSEVVACDVDGVEYWLNCRGGDWYYEVH